MAEVRQTNQPQDRHLVSIEPWEIEYIHRQFPSKSHEQIVQAVENAKRELHSNDREKIMEFLRQTLH